MGKGWEGGGGLGIISLSLSLYLSYWIHIFFSQHCRVIYGLLVVLSQWGVFVLWIRCIEADIWDSKDSIHFEILFCLSNRLRKMEDRNFFLHIRFLYCLNIDSSYSQKKLFVDHSIIVTILGCRFSKNLGLHFWLNHVFSNT